MQVIHPVSPVSANCGSIPRLGVEFSTWRTTGRRGFTLIELLTVIATIGILAAILIPVVGAVRQSARSAKCITNLREIHLAIAMHVDDREGYPRARLLDLPGHDPAFWFGAIGSYLGEGRAFVQQDWEIRKPDTVFACPDGDPKAWASDYGINGYLLAAGNSVSVGQTVRDAMIEDLTAPLLAGDSSSWQIGHPGAFATINIRYRHGERANIVHFGGNVSQIRKADLDDPDFVRRLAGKN